MPYVIAPMRFLTSTVAPLLAATVLGGCHCSAPAQATAEQAPAPPKPFVPSATCPIVRPTLAATTAVPVDEAAANENAEDDLELTAVSAAYQKSFNGKRYEEALACAQELSRLAPDDPRGHLDRARSLEALEQTEDANAAYGRALALDPDNPEVLLAAARFQVKLATNDSFETAVLYARRGRETQQNVAAAADLAATEAEALNGVGRSPEALNAAESALALNSDQPTALTERGVALFEILHFEDADRALAEARTHAHGSAKAFYYSALLAERQGRADEAKRFFAEATRLDPESYPVELDVSSGQFQKIIDEQVAALTREQQTALKSTDFSWTDLPSQEDLLKGDPVLSPTIVGVFRPGEPGEKNAILVYRKNLLHVVRTMDELKSEVRETLLHELGHLAGEDDEELRDRGL